MRQVLAVVTVLLIAPAWLFAGQEDAVKAAAIEAKEKEATTGPLWVGVGDDWFDLGKRYPKARKQYEARGYTAYAKALPLVDGVWRTKLRERLHKLAGMPVDYEKGITKDGVALCTGWDPLGAAAGAYLETGFGYTGKRSGKMLKWGKDNKAGNSWITAAKFKVQPGKECTVTAMVFSNEADVPAEINFRIYDSVSTCLSQNIVGVEGDLPMWRQYTVKGTVPQGATFADVCFWSRLTSGVYWIDDVSVKCDGKELLRNGGFEER